MVHFNCKENHTNLILSILFIFYLNDCWVNNEVHKLKIHTFLICYHDTRMDAVRRMRPFEITAEQSRLPTEWQKWKRELERYFDANNITSQWEKRSILLYVAGPDIQEIFDHLPGTDEVPHIVADPPYYDVAIRKLDEHFEPMRRRNYERHLFRQISQNPMSDSRISFSVFVFKRSGANLIDMTLGKLKTE